MQDNAGDARRTILEYRAGLQAALDSLPVDAVNDAIQCLRRAYDQGRQVFIIGNGGSAATASHMACDLAKSVLGKDGDRATKRFRVIALTDNIPLITAWGNDLSYQSVFAQQLRNLANRGDVLVVLTASGNSPNIVEAVTVARELGLQTMGLLGFNGGVVKGLLDRSIVVECDNHGHVEDTHLALNHVITAYFKQLLQGG